MNYEEEEKSSWKFWKKRRYVVGIFVFFGSFTMYILRVNLSIAIVKMTNNYTIINADGNVVSYDREFDWNSKQQGIILSSFFYGYICTQLLGGWLASRIGGKRVFGFGIATTSFFTIITPPITRYSYYLLIAVRVLEGIFEGVAYPAIFALWANWAPPLERSKLTTLAISGNFFGVVVAMPVCGIMAEKFGWPSLFYAFGAFGCLWYICWSFIVKDQPQDDPYISASELKYINDTLGSVDTEQISHPWKAMLSSPAVWAIIVVHVCSDWGLSTMITQLPTYMNDVLNFQLEEAGLLSALPYLMTALTAKASGNLADYLRSKNILSTTHVRKIFSCSGCIIRAIFMVCTAYTLIPSIAVTCITIAAAFEGLILCGFGVNYIDIAPRHASVLLGIGNSIGHTTGIISPIVTGYIVQNKKAEEWRIVFLIIAVIYIIGAVVYGILGTGEEQPWAVKFKRNSKTHYDNPTLKLDNLTKPKELQ